MRPSGEVLCAHSTSMAGLGEACSHVGAVLFYLEATVNRRDSRSCTDGENSWLPPNLAELDCRPVAEIDFASSAMKKRRLDNAELPQTKTAKKAASGIARRPREDQVRRFFSALSKSGGRPAILSLVPPYADSYVPLASRYPEILFRNLRRTQRPNSWDEVQEECHKVLGSLSIEPEVSYECYIFIVLQNDT